MAQSVVRSRAWCPCWMDHAAALGDAAQADGLAADDGLHRRLLLDRIRGHDGVGGGVAGRLGVLQRRIQRGMPSSMTPTFSVWPMTPVEETSTSSGLQPMAAAAAAHIFSAFSSPGGAGVGVAAVGHDGPGLAVGEVRLIHRGWGQPSPRFRKHRRGGAVHIGDNERQVLFPRGVGFHATWMPAARKPGRRIRRLPRSSYPFLLTASGPRSPPAPA